MDVSIAEAKNRLTQLIRAVEQGESVVITRKGKPVAQIAPPPPQRRPVRFGGLKDRVRLLPGWDDPVDLDRFLRRRAVKGYLLDANVALRATVDPASLSPAVRRAIARGPTFLSVVSYWEVLLKSMKGQA